MQFNFSLVYFQITWNTILLTNFSGPSALELSTHRCSLCSLFLYAHGSPHCRLSAEVQLFPRFERDFRNHCSSSVEFSIQVLLFICIVTTPWRPVISKTPARKTLMKLLWSLQVSEGLWQSRTRHFLITSSKKVWGKGTLKGTRTTEDLSSESVGSVLYLCCLGKCHRDRELRSHAAELPNQWTLRAAFHNLQLHLSSPRDALSS